MQRKFVDANVPYGVLKRPIGTLLVCKLADIVVRYVAARYTYVRCSSTRVYSPGIYPRLRGKKRRRRRVGEKRREKGVDSTDANSPTKMECIKPKAQPARGTICISVLAAASIATAKHVPRHPIKGLATLCFLLPGVTLPAPRDIGRNSSSEIVCSTAIYRSSFLVKN